MWGLSLLKLGWVEGFEPSATGTTNQVRVARLFACVSKHNTVQHFPARRLARIPRYITTLTTTMSFLGGAPCIPAWEILRPSLVTAIVGVNLLTRFRE